ncbi:molybdopterin synthase catalytic subunit MoaE [Shewanella surugensis]|uniref:Molybdopterin synthase catalytic subunit n=1 Tax=Shewanella surugensis TaxID=212020 RepID=A0ABT0L9L3_9GAMM|nr:molybdopterin synthase catalytic subunit MoaE [Shewanella surugensis]MCL1124399.1 molybdopterin synthase catalytic subunit MoaE [Shewanella surugensis]
MIRVQIESFSLADEYQLLNQDKSDGAIVTFVGKVRDFNEGSQVTQLTLEHYPGMTEAILSQIEQEARSRWPLNYVRIIHRVGTLALGEQIVFIGVTSQHRKAAFDACEFLIDFLKTKAPFWKLEANEASQRWVDAKVSDDLAAHEWKQE